MQVYANSNRLSLNTIFFFAVVLFVAFLPVSTFLFFLKNDAFNGYFPPKFFMSESIHAGHLPLWNPYINYGLPQYGDMSSGFWSPITWLVASTVGYNAYTLTIEVLFYILLGGLGMYKLTGRWQLQKQVRIIAGIAFMCCGYNVAHLQHFNWLSGAAFLPWCLWAYLNLLQSFSFKKALVGALLFYMLIASAHPGITICAIYFFIGVFLFDFFSNKQELHLKKRLVITIRTQGIFVLLLLLLSAGIIAGYLDILPYFVRGEKVSLQDSLGHPTNLQSWISAMLPFATVKNDAFFNTDLTMRNSYFGLPLLLFLIFTILGRKSNWQKFLLITGLLFALLSSGGFFKEFAYRFIPFTGYVRLNGEFRIFTLLCFIILVAIELDKFARGEKRFEGSLKWIYYFLEVVLFAAIIYGMYHSFSSHVSFVYRFSNISNAAGLAAKLKALIDALSFSDTLWIQGIIQLLVLWIVKYALKNNSIHLLKKIAIADLMIACLLNIPFTGVGKASVAQVQTVLNKSPKGIPIPLLQPVIKNDTISTEESGLVGDWSMYNKQIGAMHEAFYPVALKNTQTFFEKTGTQKEQAYLEQSFIFSSNAKNITVNNFSPTEIVATSTSDTASTIILKQNYYPHWYYQVNGVQKPVDSFGICFMSAPVSKGDQQLSFIFDPAAVKFAMLLSLIVFILYCLLVIFLKPIPSSPSLPKPPTHP
ncbi:hypothetical protein [Ferruginibacter sp.]